MLAGGDGDLIVSARNDLGDQSLHPFGPPWLYSALILASRRRQTRIAESPALLTLTKRNFRTTSYRCPVRDSYCGINPGSSGPESIQARLRSGWRTTRCGHFGIGHVPSSAGVNQFMADDRSILRGRCGPHRIGATTGGTGPEGTSSARLTMLPHGERGLRDWPSPVAEHRPPGQCSNFLPKPRLGRRA